MAGNVNGGLVDFFHGLQVAIMLTVMTNVVQFAHWTVKRKRKNQPHCSKYGPVYILMVASVLVCVQPVCMLVIGSWTSIDNFFFDGGDTGAHCVTDSACGSGACMAPLFECNATIGTCTQLQASSDGVTCSPYDPCPDTETCCTCAMDSNALVPNTTIGLCIQIFGTYLGFGLLFLGVFQATNLHVKLCNKWKVIRGYSATPQQATAAPAQDDGGCADGS